MEHTAPQWSKQRRRRGYEDGSKQSFVLRSMFCEFPDLASFWLRVHKVSKRLWFCVIKQRLREWTIDSKRERERERERKRKPLLLLDIKSLVIALKHDAIVLPLTWTTWPRGWGSSKRRPYSVSAGIADSWGKCKIPLIITTDLAKSITDTPRVACQRTIFWSWIHFTTFGCNGNLISIC